MRTSDSRRELLLRRNDGCEPLIFWLSLIAPSRAISAFNRSTGLVDAICLWWWGRASVGDHRIVTYDIHGKKSVGGCTIDLYYVGRTDRIEVSAFGDRVAVEQGPPVQHPNPNHGRPTRSSVSLFCRRNQDHVFDLRPATGVTESLGRTILDKEILARV